MKKLLLILIALITLTSCESDRIQVLADDGELVSIYDYKEYRKVSNEVVILTITSSRTGVSHSIDRVYVDTIPATSSIEMTDNRGDYTVYYSYRKGTIVKD